MVPAPQVRAERPFNVYHADETFPALWAASPSAAQELPDLDADQLTAISSARMLQVISM
jgi:transcriptional accessory protein Tex/SPT6